MTVIFNLVQNLQLWEKNTGVYVMIFLIEVTYFYMVAFSSKSPF